MFDSKEICDLLSGLGVAAGDTIYVHVSLKHMPGFGGRPQDLIGGLLELVGGGAVLSPAYPDRATLIIKYMDSNPVLDVLKTPTKMGMFQEIFRRNPKAFRSMHPWATTSGIGGRAEWLLKDHHLEPGPYSPLSPYLRMRDIGGKIVGMGTDLNTSTYAHVVDDLLKEYYPFPVYMQAPRVGRVIDREGNELMVPALMIRQEIISCIYPMEIKPFLLDAGALKEDVIEDAHFYVVGIPEYIRIATDVAMKQMAAGEPPCWLREHCRKYGVDFKHRPLE